MFACFLWESKHQQHMSYHFINSVDFTSIVILVWLIWLSALRHSSSIFRFPSEGHTRKQLLASLKDS